ncbi:M23 family metallopeptidase [Sphingosinicella sp. BN140058]|uniref:M23 family metallopeptidase n=1 Tax=Sphingosinicella sp. BN140058 TaxID=1892855 RepID=UPI0013EDCE5D|nr:M23 family metallopeptidase [Sphingosinicella sp. BN140058]
MLRLRFGAMLLCLLPEAPAAHAAEGRETQLQQAFAIEARGTPAPVVIEGVRLLRYELHLTNFAARPLSLERLTIRARPSARPLANLEGESLARAALLVGGERGIDPRTIEPGRRVIVYIDLAMPESLPAQIDHLIQFEGTSAGEVIGGTLAVDPRPLPQLGPPLRGGPWAAIYDPGMERGHRRVPYAVAGQVTIPGRHAIDWMRVGDDGAALGKSDGLGAEVLAVADAVVAAARDGMAEPVGERPAVALADASGNYLALDLGGGRFAFYEHLMPGLRVKVGDRVRRGQVIGRLGSTGQASRPHLHFHVADAASTLGAEGLPYRLGGGTIVGRFPSIETFGQNAPWTVTKAAPTDFPGPNAVVLFP